MNDNSQLKRNEITTQFKAKINDGGIEQLAAEELSLAVQLQLKLLPVDFGGEDEISKPMVLNKIINVSAAKAKVLNVSCLYYFTDQVLKKLAHIVELDLSRLKLTSLPVIVCQLESLITLSINGNNLLSLPQEIIHLARYPCLQSL